MSPPPPERADERTPRSQAGGGAPTPGEGARAPGSDARHAGEERVRGGGSGAGAREGDGRVRDRGPDDAPEAGEERVRGGSSDPDAPEAGADEVRPQPASLPPEVSDPAAAAAAVPGESDHEAEQGVSPSSAPEARPHPEIELPPAARAGRLLFGLLGAPIMWAVQMQTLYSLGTMACGDRAGISLHIVSLLALAVAAAGALVSWRAWRAVGPEWPPDAGDVPDRARFMALAGVLTSGGFFLLILAQAIPTLVFPICR